ncbi:Organic hydroperoxide resistance transcriptional regulator [Tenacibaculum litopenaei]|uniref:MarR family winged helix-turn-helix transcriptional regulator n=1 Tax=Tenacibaculum litopenaei TaxID=396016 RepID=UPI00389489BC
MTKTCEQLKLENQLCFPLYAASRLTTKLYAPHLKQLDITYPQYLVLLVLWEYETMAVKDIGSLLFLESNTLTPLLKRLEQKELVSRTRATDDERTVHIALTAKGKQLQVAAASIPKEIERHFANDSFSDEELKDFRNNLVKLLSLLHKQL